MNKQGITEVDFLAGLHDIRLPSEAAGGLASEILAALGIGLLLAVCIGLLAPLVTKRKSKIPLPGLPDRIEALKLLPDEGRAIALLHLLKENNPEAAAGFCRNIYSPGGIPQISILENELMKAGGGDG
ncbi:MAG: hypothetical protein GY742_03965 [Hyphomicrobiales bacterium]|nr:hypothetical protein [Hyphomicrobiales bacterium]